MDIVQIFQIIITIDIETIELDIVKYRFFFDNGKNFFKTKDEFRKRNREHALFSFRSPYRYTSSLKITQLKAVPTVVKNKNCAKHTADLDDKMTNNFHRLNYIKKNKI